MRAAITPLSILMESYMSNYGSEEYNRDDESLSDDVEDYTDLSVAEGDPDESAYDLDDE